MKLKLTKQGPATKSEKFFDRNDNFAASVKSFNFEGRQKVHTSVGVILTIIVKVILYAYAAKMFKKLVEKSNPNVMTEVENHRFSDEHNTLDMAQVSSADPFNEDRRPFKFAFAMRGYADKKFKNRTDMVDWEVHVYTGKG